MGEGLSFAYAEGFNVGVLGVEEAGIGSPIDAGVETTVAPSVQVV